MQVRRKFRIGLALLLTIVATACIAWRVLDSSLSTDRALARQLVGTWAISNASAAPGASLEETITLYAGGMFTENQARPLPHEQDLENGWRVKDGKLILMHRRPKTNLWSLLRSNLPFASDQAQGRPQPEVTCEVLWQDEAQTQFDLKFHDQSGQRVILRLTRRASPGS